MAENRPQKFRKSIFEVKKSNFLFDSINVSGMYCNLSNTFKRVIFTFLKLWHTAKSTFADSTKLKMAENWPQKFRKSIFEVEKSNFLFDSIKSARMQRSKRRERESKRRERETQTDAKWTYAIHVESFIMMKVKLYLYI